jgi:alpha-methylacyl-CoA racemase
VMERLGLAPDVCMARNPALIFGRITGWGQTGPLSGAAGHDLNYLAMSGLLHDMGRSDSPPSPPMNLIADCGGGGMMLAFGVVCALLEARRSGCGQVVDTAMAEGSALLGAMIYGFKAFGDWQPARGTNMLTGGAHFYDTYACADGRFISVAAIEPQFYALLLQLCGIDDRDFDAQMDRAKWPLLKAKIAAIFLTKSRDAWCVLMEGTDVCFAPVLDMDEAPQHAHHRARGAFIELDGVTQPAPVPRFSRTHAAVTMPPAAPGEHGEAILRDWGVSEERIGGLRAKKVI